MYMYSQNVYCSSVEDMRRLTCAGLDGARKSTCATSSGSENAARADLDFRDDNDTCLR